MTAAPPARARTGFCPCAAPILNPPSSHPRTQLPIFYETLRKYGHLAHHWRIPIRMRFFAPIPAQTAGILAQAPRPPRQVINPGAVINSEESAEKRASPTPTLITPPPFDVRRSMFDVRLHRMV